MADRKLALVDVTYGPRMQDFYEDAFSRALSVNKLALNKGATHTLQINMGLLCNQACRHCHLEAGPNRMEVMSRQTIDEVVGYARRARFQTVDITGGAPEMNPHLGYLIRNIAPLVPRLMLRSNLTAISKQEKDYLLGLCKEHRVVLVASLPSVNVSQTDSQRGKGVWEASIGMLKKLNELGYGRPETGLELNLVSNPTGAFLPACQSEVEDKVRLDLERRWDIVFDNLFVLANVPLGRFRTWLDQSGNLEGYSQKLRASFNPLTVEGLMCRTLVSVSWNGFLFDCDFNLAMNMYLSGRKVHVSQMQGLPESCARIPTGDHCFACTAGSGFT